MMEGKEERIASSAPPYCDECEPGTWKAAVECQHCQFYLCDLHARSHRRSRVTKQHSLVDLRCSSADDSPCLAQSKPGENMVTGGEELITSDDHDGEEKVVSVTSEELQSTANKLKAILARLRIETNKEKEALCELQQQTETARQAVHEEGKLLHNLLDEAVAAALSQLDTRNELQQKAIQQRLDKQEMLMASAETTLATLSKEDVGGFEKVTANLEALQQEVQLGEERFNDGLVFVATPSEIEQALGGGIGAIRVKTELASARHCSIDWKNGSAILNVACTDFIVTAKTLQEEAIEGRADQAALCATASTESGYEHTLTMVKRQSPGAYTLQFTPVAFGVHTVSVTAQGKHINGSPKQIQILRYPLEFNKKSTEPGGTLYVTEDCLTVRATGSGPGRILANPSFSSGQHRWRFRVGGLSSSAVISMKVGVLVEQATSSKPVAVGWTDYSEGLNLERPGVRGNKLPLAEWHNGDELEVCLNFDTQSVSLTNQRGLSHSFQLEKITGKVWPFFALNMPGGVITLLPI